MCVGTRVLFVLCTVGLRRVCWHARFVFVVPCGCAPYAVCVKVEDRSERLSKKLAFDFEKHANSTMTTTISIYKFLLTTFLGFWVMKIQGIQNIGAREPRSGRTSTLTLCICICITLCVKIKVKGAKSYKLMHRSTSTCTHICITLCIMITQQRRRNWNCALRTSKPTDPFLADLFLCILRPIIYYCILILTPLPLPLLLQKKMTGVFN